MGGRLRARLFRSVHDVSAALRRRLTPAGRLLAGTTLVAGALGVDTRQSYAAMLFALGSALLVTASVLALGFRGRLAIARHLPRYATVGLPLHYDLDLRNLSARALRDVTVHDELAAPPPSAQDLRAYRSERRAGTNWLDRLVGYPDWVDLVRQHRGAEVAAVPAPPLAPRAGTRVPVTLRPLRRGILRFGPTWVARPDPLGLVNGLRLARSPGDLVVLPRRHPCAVPALAGRRREQPGGIARAGQVGDAQELMGVRDYRPGDPVRRIHWRSWARTGRPIVKELQDEFFVRHAVVLDTATAPGARFEAMVEVAASHLEALSGPDGLLDLIVLGDRVQRHTSGRGLAAPDALLAALASVQATPGAPLERLPGALAREASRISGCVCVLGAWDTPRRGLLESLRRRGVEALAVVVADGAARPGVLAPGVRRVRAACLDVDLAP